MIEPTLAEVQERAGEGTLFPIYLEKLADLETPVSAYMKLRGGQGAFILESIEGGERLGRYSFIGIEPTGKLSLGAGEAALSGELGNETIPFTDPLGLIDELLHRHKVPQVRGLPRFRGGAVGYLSYDLSRWFERLPPHEEPGLGLPLGILGWYQTVLAFDHLRRTIKIITHIPTDGDVRAAYFEGADRLRGLAARLSAPLGDIGPAVSDMAGVPLASATAAAEPASNTTRAQFEEAVLRAKAYIAAGEAIQVVLSQRLAIPCSSEPLALYRALRSINPSPYMYFLDYGAFQIVGSSPEMLVRVEDSTVAVYPIAGTRRRGANQQEDERLAAELAADEKEKAEHYMLVDLGRNDVGRVSEAGSVRVSQLLGVERYSHVMHLVSHVEGKLRPGLRPVDALRSGFPAGTVSGAPKVRAMEIIAELERDSRGPYAGAVGYFGFDGTIDTAIAIRTAVLMDGVAHVQAGAGIVADSVPEREYEETMNKATAMVRAVRLAESI